MLALIAGVMQLLGAWFAARHARADPGLAKSAVRRLISIGSRAGMAENLAQKAYEKGTAAERRDALGRISVMLSYIQEDSASAVHDWRHVHDETLADLMPSVRPSPAMERQSLAEVNDG